MSVRILFCFVFSWDKQQHLSSRAMWLTLHSSVSMCVSVSVCVPQILPCIQVEQASARLHLWAKCSSSAVVRNKDKKRKHQGSRWKF